MSHVQILLDCLDRVRPSGNGWRSNCPAHDDKRAALIINEGDDGRILLYCYAECSGLEIVQSLGLTLADLFPQRITKDMTPAQRRTLARERRQAGWSAARDMLQHEGRVIWVAGKQIKTGEPLTEPDSGRLDLALERITEAGRVLSGKP